MSKPKEIIDYAPHVFAFVGAALILFAAYVGGGDELTCVRHSDRMNCQLVSRRWLNLAVMERRNISDVVTSFLRRTDSDAGDQTTVNDALVLRTRVGEEVPTLGGEPARDFGSELDEALCSGNTKPLAAANNYWPVSAGCFALGAVFALFGGVALSQS
jgi:hypothetical protein